MGTERLYPSSSIPQPSEEAKILTLEAFQRPDGSPLGPGFISLVSGPVGYLNDQRPDWGRKLKAEEPFNDQTRASIPLALAGLAHACRMLRAVTPG
jgi:hypothetical protein